MRYDPDSSSWKTCGPSLIGDLDLMSSSLTLPASGSMRNGYVFQRPASEPPTSATGGSASPGLPTPRARDSKGRGWEDGLPAVVELLPTPTVSDTNGTGPPDSPRNDTLRAQVALLPTPRASAQENRQTKRSPTQKAGKHGLCLAAEMSELSQKSSRPSPGALLPTPRATDGTKGGPNQRGSSGDLMLPSAVQQLLPTPTATRPATTANYRPDGTPYSSGYGMTLLDAARTLLPTPTSADSERSSATYARGNPTLIGAVTDPPSDAGNTSSDDLPLGQLTIEDALRPPSSNG